MPTTVGGVAANWSLYPDDTVFRTHWGVRRAAQLLFGGTLAMLGGASMWQSYGWVPSTTVQTQQYHCPPWAELSPTAPCLGKVAGVATTVLIIIFVWHELYRWSKIFGCACL